jgi:branched-subunit amino acid transport protein
MCPVQLVERAELPGAMISRWMSWTPDKVESTLRWPDVLMRCVTLTSAPELAYIRTIVLRAFAAHVM